jgi:hypothetical protein
MAILFADEAYSLMKWFQVQLSEVEPLKWVGPVGAVQVNGLVRRLLRPPPVG